MSRCLPPLRAASSGAVLAFALCACADPASPMASLPDAQVPGSDASVASGGTSGGSASDGSVPVDAATHHDASSASGTGGANGGSSCDEGLRLTMRDFKPEHADFEGNFTALQGIVEAELGADKKPVYAHTGATAATSSPANFDQWYRDVDGVNMAIEVQIQFEETSPGVFVYDNSAFFPLDGMGFGNGPAPTDFLGMFLPGLGGVGGASHNYLFTTEAHTTFTYQGGEVFTFRGDDDLWVFLNGRLAVDLGGIHGAQTQSVQLDDLVQSHGFEVGQSYPMDIFHAERHTVESNFRIETTIDLSCIENVELI